MAQGNRRLHTLLLGLAITAPLALAGNALASDPLAGDDYAPPSNSNIFMLYDFYQNDNRYGGQLGNPHGPDATHNTYVSANIIVARYLRSFDLEGYHAGVQIFLPYVTYLGDQHVGINDLGSAAPGLLPSLGAGRGDLSHTNGFAQPNIGFYIFPIANYQTGTFLLFEPWIAPPVSSFNKNNNLNGNQNSWTFENEIALRKVLIGTPDTQNLTIEIWDENYFYMDNSNSAFTTPSVSANNIPAAYTFGHDFISPEIPDSNPVRAASITPATFREQPTTELRVYLPYQFYPATHAYIAPGLFQSFGGKETYKIKGVGVVDSGIRTSETQLRLVLGSFVTPTLQLALTGDYDVAAHGTPYNRTIEFRLLKFF